MGEQRHWKQSRCIRGELLKREMTSLKHGANLPRIIQAAINKFPGVQLWSTCSIGRRTTLTIIYKLIQHLKSFIMLWSDVQLIGVIENQRSVHWGQSALVLTMPRWGRWELPGSLGWSPCLVKHGVALLRLLSWRGGCSVVDCVSPLINAIGWWVLLAVPMLMSRWSIQVLTRRRITDAV